MTSWMPGASSMALIRVTSVAEAPREGVGIRWVLPATVSPRYVPAEDRQGVGRPPAVSGIREMGVRKVNG